MKNAVKRIVISTVLLALFACCMTVLVGCFGCSHSYDITVLKAATCLENGEQRKDCIYCDESFTEIIYASDAYHRYVVTGRLDPTCETAGAEDLQCSICSGISKRILEPLGHSLVETNVEPTCTEDGFIIISCERCEYREEEVVPAAHTYSDANVILEPGCESEGLEEFVCSVCGIAGENPIPALGHVEIDAEAVDPTCQKEGLTAGTKCERCEKSLSGRETVAVADHSYENEICIWCEAVKTYTVTYVYEGDYEFPQQTYKYGETIILPDTSMLEDETTAFTGWFTEDGTEYTVTSTVTSDLTLYASIGTYTSVSNIDELKAIAENPKGNYILTADIDAQGTIWTPIDEFSGNLNGNGHTIYNMVLNSTEKKNFGFIRVNKGTVKDLGFKDFVFNATYTPEGYLSFGVAVGHNAGVVSNVSILSGSVMLNASRDSREGVHYSYFGTVVGFNDTGAVIEKCKSYVDFEISLTAISSEERYKNFYFEIFSYLGGIVGRNCSTVSDCQYKGDVVAKLNAQTRNGNVHSTNRVFLGGIAGENLGGEITRSTATSAITFTNTTNRDSAMNKISAGVLVGKNAESGLVEQCFSVGNITTNPATELILGGFIGANDANSSIKSCYTTASVKSEDGGHIGGFVGSDSGIIQNSYSAGNLESGGGMTGGFVGSLNAAGSISKCYSTGNVITMGGEFGHFVGYAEGVVLKCYFMESSTVMSDGIYQPIVTEYNTIEGIVYTKLWNEDFLINEMYWEENGWTVVVDENPLLTWEMDVSHQFVTNVVEPTCDRGGFTIYNCSDCSRLFIKDYVAPNGHKLETAVTIPATCSAGGYTLARCTVDGCGHEETVEVTEKIPHKASSLSVTYELAPTCTSAGKTIYYCSDCKNGDIVVDVEPLGHSGIYVSTVSSPTCKEEGKDIYFCSHPGCGEYEQTVARLPHTVEKVGYLPPSCGKHIDGEDNVVYTPENGHMPGEKCSVCGDILSGCDAILPHNFELTETISAAGCATVGEGKYTCRDCQYVKVDEIGAVGHTDNDLNYICDICDTYIFSEVPESSYVHIGSAGDLDKVREDLDGYFILDADIDLSGILWEPIGTEERPFKGVFYGNNHTVKGLKLDAANQTADQVFGLFGYNAGTIVRVKVESVDVTVLNGSCVIGGVAAYNSGEIIGCYLTGESVFNLGVSLTVNDYAHHTVKNTMIAGGIVGVNDLKGAVIDCESSGRVTLNAVSNTAINSPDLYNKVMSLIYNTKAETDLYVSFGAIAGTNAGVIDKCKVVERVTVAMAFTADLAYQKGKIVSVFNVYAADIVGYNSGSVSASVATGSEYVYLKGYNYSNWFEELIQGKLYEITVTFVNHSDNTPYKGLIGGNEGNVLE